MDPAYISALAALAGSVIGGLTSLGASWISQNAQARIQLLVEDQNQRRGLYRSFIEEASRLYGDALGSNKAEVTNMVGLYAMVSRMRMLSTPRVVDSADTVIRKIVDTYLAPNKTLSDLRGSMGHNEIDLLRHFSEACRDELRGVR
jgi:hypothetical protein